MRSIPLINAFIAFQLTLNMLAGGFFLYAFSIEVWAERSLWVSGLLLLVWHGQYLFTRAVMRRGGILLALVAWLPNLLLVYPSSGEIWFFGPHVVMLGAVVIVSGLIFYRRREPLAPLWIFGFGCLVNVLMLRATGGDWFALMNSSWSDYLDNWFSLYGLLLGLLLAVAWSKSIRS